MAHVLIRVESGVTLSLEGHYVKHSVVIEMDRDALQAYGEDKKIILDKILEGHLPHLLDVLNEEADRAVWEGIDAKADDLFGDDGKSAPAAVYQPTHLRGRGGR